MQYVKNIAVLHPLFIDDVKNVEYNCQKRHHITGRDGENLIHVHFRLLIRSLRLICLDLFQLMVAEIETGV